MTTSIKITSLTNIGSNIAYTTLVPVVNMAGTPETQKANLQIVGNLILNGAGGANFARAAQANIALSVANANQPNITSLGNGTAVSIAGNLLANGYIGANGNVLADNLIVTGNVQGNFLIGDGSQITGLQSLQGTQGIQGITGAGTQGIAGSTGIQGFAGSTGIQGVAGSTGIQGVAGSTGIQGVTGSTGIQGVTGSTGIQGVAGSTGIQGIAGSIGIQGIAGSTGIQGVAGGPGIQGLQGLQGSTAGLPLANGNSNINIATANGPITLTSAGNTWTFGNDGNLIVSSGLGTFIKSTPGGYLGLATIDDGTDLPAQLVSLPANAVSGTTAISVYANSAQIQTDIAGTMKTWVFDNLGVSTFPVSTYGNLPSPSTAGKRAFISDANLAASGNFGATVSGGGSNTVPVYSDGSNWYIG